VRITVLTYVHAEGTRDWDVVVNQVAAALRKNKHKVSILGVHKDVRRLVQGLARRKPDLVFNLLEEFGDDPGGNMAVCGLLDTLGYCYTGSGPGDLYLTQDKALSKKLLAFEQILYPRFAVFHKDKDKGFETGGNLKMPMFVKPVAMDSSIGIGKKSLVRDSTQLMQQVYAIHEECDDAALAEEYIEGREFYVGVIGKNGDAQALPPIEVDFSGMPEGAPRVYDESAKWDKDSKEFKGVKVVIADLPDELNARLCKVSLDAFRALRVRDYGRVDLRVTPTGDIYVLEVNASCYLEKNDEFAMAAKAAGIGYPELIQRIVDLAAARCRKKR
jgi:D-alanine-D-alanine ligase